MSKTLYNSYSKNCAGYCKLHNCDLTVKQIRNKQCLQKQCWHLNKNEHHMWWKQRAATKIKRQNRKMNLEKVVNGNV